MGRPCAPRLVPVGRRAEVSLSHPRTESTMRPTLLTPALALPLLLAAGCGPNHGEDAAAGCDEVKTDLAPGEVSVLGFSGADVLALVTGPRTATLEWAGGAQTEVTVEAMDAGGAVRFVDSEPAEHDGGGMEAAAAMCEDRLEIDAVLRFATDDGAFAEEWSVVLNAEQAGSATFYVEFDPDVLTGTFDLADFMDPGEFDEVASRVSGSVSETGTTGMVQATGSKTEDTPDGDGTAMAQIVEIGMWHFEEPETE